eukprot:m.245300 g.245300  ORF g.245300 m.245300 type:complete len:193 (+) comp14666_c0_seq1:28-606(+)
MRKAPAARKANATSTRRPKIKPLEEMIEKMENDEDCPLEIAYEKNDEGLFTMLRLDAPEFYAGESVESLLPLLKNHPCLESLGLVWISDFEEEEHEIFHTIATLRKVHSLEIAAPIDHITCGASLFNAVKQLPTLRKLDLTSGHILPDELKTFQVNMAAARPDVDCSFNEDDLEKLAENYGAKRRNTDKPRP